MELQRDDAITLLAYSMAASDGVTTLDEDDAITQRLRARGIRVPTQRTEELRRIGSESYDEESALLRHIVEALPTERDRHDALRIALDVVWADANLEPGEMTQVLELADELGIGRKEASRIIQEYAA